MVRNDPARTAPGLNLYSSGHRSQALLMRMDGTVVHTWQADFLDAFPEHAELLQHQSAHSWRRVALLPDGSLLAIWEGLGIAKLTPDSRIAWASLNRAHHDLEPLPNGNLLVLTRIPHARPDGPPILEDFVAELDRDGRELRRVSVLRALERSPHAELDVVQPDWHTGDLLHTNALHLLDDRASRANHAMTAGRLLISSRNQDLIAVLDLNEQAVVWAASGPWSRQHDVEITPSGRLMLFDNQGPGEGRSRVLILDPADPERILWTWPPRPEVPFHSEVLGAAQELPNGNLLITESTRGRALEVTPRGEVVWDFHNPETARGRYVAAIYEMIRVPTEAAAFAR